MSINTDQNDLKHVNPTNIRTSRSNVSRSINMSQASDANNNMLKVSYKLKTLENDEIKIANRVAMLEQEEMKMLKKIEETRKRAQKIIDSKKANE